MRRVVVCLGLVLMGLLAIVLVVAGTADSMTVVTARHTLQHRLSAALPDWLQPVEPATLPTGALAGTVTDAAGQPVPEATVIVADRRGVAYRARTTATGEYRLDGVPAGRYRPVVAASGHGPVASMVALPTPFDLLGTLRWRPAVGVRDGQVTTADLRLTPPRRLAPVAGASLTLGAEDVVERTEPFPGRARRQAFSLSTPRRTTNGLIHVPEGPGPFPVVLIVFPGPPESWESISIPIAAGGFTVVSYFPRNFPDLNADTAELLFLTEALTRGELTPHAAPGRQCAAGGSFSTIWTFLLLRQTDAYRCVLSLGGITDAFLYRADWTAGRIIPDPTLAPVPEIMAALGTPDLAPDLFLQFSIIEHTTSLPPIFIVHGTADTIVPINQSVALATRLQAEGRPHEFRLYDQMEHYLAADEEDADTADLLARTLAFFHRHLD